MSITKKLQKKLGLKEKELGLFVGKNLSTSQKLPHMELDALQEKAENMLFMDYLMGKRSAAWVRQSIADFPIPYISIMLIKRASSSIFSQFVILKKAKKFLSHSATLLIL